MKTVLLSCILLLVLLMSGCKNDPQQLTQLRPNDVVLCFGDSLTQGVGAEQIYSYPAQLQRLIARPVVNAGVSGEVSAEGARRLPTLLDEHKPELLVLCHGGNDLLQRLSRDELKNNLRRMFEAANQRDVSVVMIAVPQPHPPYTDAVVYRELAEELKIPLLEGSLRELLMNPEMKSDDIHLNAQGYRQLAEALAEKLYRLGTL